MTKQEIPANVDPIRRDVTIEAWPATHATFRLGDRVRKLRGSQWKGRIVGWYSTRLTREGYAVESDTEVGSVQIYPVSALELVEKYVAIWDENLKDYRWHSVAKAQHNFGENQGKPIPGFCTETIYNATGRFITRDDGEIAEIFE